MARQRPLSVEEGNAIDTILTYEDKWGRKVATTKEHEAAYYEAWRTVSWVSKSSASWPLYGIREDSTKSWSDTDTESLGEVAKVLGSWLVLLVFSLLIWACLGPPLVYLIRSFMTSLITFAYP